MPFFFSFERRKSPEISRDSMMDLRGIEPLSESLFPVLLLS